MKLLDLDDEARANHGVITLERSGLSRDAWYRAIRNGSIEQLHPGVARLPGTPRSHRQRIAAAVLAVSTDCLAVPADRDARREAPVRVRGGATVAMASHRSAAWLWLDRGGGGDDVDGDNSGRQPVDITVLDRRRSRTLQGVAVHRPTDRARLAPQRIENIRCTNILRTLIDLGAVDPGGVSDLLGHALSTRVVNLNAVETVLLDHGRRGRPGVVALRSAVDEWTIDSKPADSVLELALRRLVERHDLPPVEFHPIVEGWEVDFRFVGTRLLVECDGWTTHGLDRDQFERDRRRDADLTAAGWIVSRHTYRAITRDAGKTAHRLRALLARQSE